MSTVKALAEVLGAVLDALQDRCTTPRCVEEQCALCRSEGPLYERLQDIIAVESAGERLVTNEAGRAAERARQSPMTATLQLETIRELRAENERLLHQLSAASDTFAEGAGAHKQYEDALEVLVATHRCEVAKLKLESDRRARSVAEAVIERVVQIGITERKAIEDINIEAIVAGEK